MKRCFGRSSFPLAAPQECLLRCSDSCNAISWLQKLVFLKLTQRLWTSADVAILSSPWDGPYVFIIWPINYRWAQKKRPGKTNKSPNSYYFLLSDRGQGEGRPWHSSWYPQWQGRVEGEFISLILFWMFTHQLTAKIMCIFLLNHTIKPWGMQQLLFSCPGSSLPTLGRQQLPLYDIRSPSLILNRTWQWTPSLTLTKKSMQFLWYQVSFALFWCFFINFIC